MKNLNKVVEHAVCGVIAVAGYVAIKAGMKVAKDEKVLESISKQVEKIGVLMNKAKDVTNEEEV